MRIPNKMEFYRRSLAGMLGNTTLQWRTLADCRTSAFYRRAVTGDCEPYPGLFGVREMKPAGRFTPNVSPEDLAAVISTYRPDGFIISPMQPDHLATLHGELVRLPDWRLYYSTAPLPVRAAFARRRDWCDGFQARSLVRARLDPSSFADLEDLLELYPTAIVEFTAYQIKVGVLPHRNTLIWEVRDY